MAISPGEPVLAGFIGAKDGGIGGDNWSCKTCKAQIITTDKPTSSFFYMPVALPVIQPTVSNH